MIAQRDAAAAMVDQAVADFWAGHRRRYWMTPPEVQAEVQLIYDSARQSALRKMKDAMVGRRVAIEDRQPVNVRIPMFVLAAADVPNCAASFKRSASSEGNAGFTVEIAGTGLGGKVNAKTSVSETFRADSGERKTIFLPVDIFVEKVTVTERGKVIGRGHRIDLARLADHEAAPGCLLLDPQVVVSLGSRLQAYPLAGDYSGGVATYDYEYVQSSVREVKVGLKYAGVDLGLSCSIGFERSLELTYDLAGGHDYTLFRVGQSDGAVWQL